MHDHAGEVTSLSRLSAQLPTLLRHQSFRLFIYTVAPEEKLFYNIP